VRNGGCCVGLGFVCGLCDGNVFFFLIAGGCVLGRC